MEISFAPSGIWKINNISTHNTILTQGIAEVLANLDKPLFYSEDMSQVFNTIAIGDSFEGVTSSDISLGHKLYSQQAIPRLSLSPTLDTDVTLTLGTIFTTGEDFNYTEVGLSGSSLFSKAVITRGHVAVNESLIVQYELRFPVPNGTFSYSYKDLNGATVTNNGSWFVPSSSLITGLSSPFYNSNRSVYTSVNSITSPVTNLETKVCDGVIVTTDSGINVSVSFTPVANIRTLQIGSISDMLSLFLVFDSLIPVYKMKTFNIQFRLNLGV